MLYRKIESLIEAHLKSESLTEQDRSAKHISFVMWETSFLKIL